MSSTHVRNEINNLRSAIEADPSGTRTGYHQHGRKILAVLESVERALHELEERVNDLEYTVQGMDH